VAVFLEPLQFFSYLDAAVPGVLADLLLVLVWCQFPCSFLQLLAACGFGHLTDFQAAAVPRSAVQERAKGF
jgi:hypothetical protein